MRFFTVALSGLLAASASVIPVSRDNIHSIAERASPSPEQTEATIAQAVYITQNLDIEIKRIVDTIDPLVRLHPNGHDSPAILGRAFDKAVQGIEALPTLSPGDDIPQYAADYYGKLVETVAEQLFNVVLDLKKLSIAVLDNEQYTSLVNTGDAKTHGFVVALNKQFQGFGCALSKSLGQGSPAGEALKVVSEQLFYILLDNVTKGQC